MSTEIQAVFTSSDPDVFEAIEELKRAEAERAESVNEVSQ